MNVHSFYESRFFWRRNDLSMGSDKLLIFVANAPCLDRGFACFRRGFLKILKIEKNKEEHAFLGKARDSAD